MRSVVRWLRRSVAVAALLLVVLTIVFWVLSYQGTYRFGHERSQEWLTGEEQPKLKRDRKFYAGGEAHMRTLIDEARGFRVVRDKWSVDISQGLVKIEFQYDDEVWMQFRNEPLPMPRREERHWNWERSMGSAPSLPGRSSLWSDFSAFKSEMIGSHSSDSGNFVILTTDGRHGYTAPAWSILGFGIGMFLLFNGLPMVRWVGDRRKRRYLRAGRCPNCGYDLRATPERCPECGLVTKVAEGG